MKKIGFLRWFLAILLGTTTLLGSIAFKLWFGTINERVQSAISAMQAHGVLGWNAVAFIQALIAASGVLPAAAMGVAAGAMYGIWLGFTLTAIGTMIGAAVAFLLARSLFRPLIQDFLSRKTYMLRLDEAIAKDGWRTVCLLRISPVMPFAAGSYALGLTSIDFSVYLLGSFAALPALFCYVVLGYLARKGLGDAAHGAGTMHLALLVIGIIATLFFVLHIGRLAKRTGLSFSGTKENLRS